MFNVMIKLPNNAAISEILEKKFNKSF